MKIGILSETHGNVSRTKGAADALISKAIDAAVHCGDIGSESVLAELYAAFQPEHIPIYAVLGNVDYPDGMFDHWSKVGEIDIMGRFGELLLDGKKIAVIHGDDTRRLWETELRGGYDYILTGHTHKKEDRTSGRTRIINPGAVHRASVPTVAVLDTLTDQLEFLAL